MGESVYPACITYCAEVAVTVDVWSEQKQHQEYVPFPGRSP